MIDTGEPRYWLTFTVDGARAVRVGGRFLRYDYSQAITLTVETNEATYREAWAASPNHPDEMEDLWWHDAEFVSGSQRDWFVRTLRGGFISYWDGEP